MLLILDVKLHLASLPELYNASNGIILQSHPEWRSAAQRAVGLCRSSLDLTPDLTDVINVIKVVSPRRDSSRRRGFMWGNLNGCRRLFGALGVFHDFPSQAPPQRYMVAKFRDAGVAGGAACSLE